MNKKVLIAIMLVIVLMLFGCAGYSGNYRYDPYSGYSPYPYGDRGTPYGYQGYSNRGGWQHW